MLLEMSSALILKVVPKIKALGWVASISGSEHIIPYLLSKLCGPPPSTRKPGEDEHVVNGQ